MLSGVTKRCSQQLQIDLQKALIIAGKFPLTKNTYYFTNKT